MDEVKRLALIALCAAFTGFTLMAFMERVVLVSGSATTWTCHVCGARRPDERISTIVRSYLVGPRDQRVGTSMRYCNDSDVCRASAELTDRFKPKGARW